MTAALPMAFPAKVRAPYVMGAHRHDASDKIGDFPTPCWGTRALLTHGPEPLRDVLRGASVWEPFAGRGTMARPLREFGPRQLAASDLHNYGAADVLSGPQFDFHHAVPEAVGLDGDPDWVFTNPYFGEATAFWHRAWEIARVGVAMFLPMAFFVGEDRYDTIIQAGRLTWFCPFVERVPLYKGRLVRGGSSSALYAWYVGLKADPRPGGTFSNHHIPPCRAVLDRAEDWRGWPSMEADAPLLDGLPGAEG